MVCVSEPTFPGCVIPVKVIALFRMRDDKGIDDKVLCVPLEDPNWNHMEVLDDLPIFLRDEISHFFSIYKQPEGKHVKVDGWYSPRGGDGRDRGLAKALAGAPDLSAEADRRRGGGPAGGGECSRASASASRWSRPRCWRPCTRPTAPCPRSRSSAFW